MEACERILTASTHYSAHGPAFEARAVPQKEAGCGEVNPAAWYLNVGRISDPAVW
jgi:hypothetical protein